MEEVCYATAFASFTEQYGELEEVLLLSFLISVSVAVILAPLFLMIYQAFVAMLMIVKDPHASEVAFTLSPSTPQRLLSTVDNSDLMAGMKSRYQRFNRNFAIAIGFYTLVTIALVLYYASSDDLVQFIVGDSRILERLLLTGFVLMMVLPVFNQMLPHGLISRLAGVVLVLFGLAFGIVYVWNEDVNNVQDVLNEMSLFLFVFTPFVGFAIQKIRNIATLLVFIVQTLLVATFLYIQGVELLTQCVRLPTLSKEMEGLLAIAQLAVFALVLWLAWQLGSLFSRRLAEAYDHRLFSDFQLQTLMWLLLITLVFSAGLHDDKSGDDIFDMRSTLPFIVLALTVAIYFFLNRRTPAWEQPRTLLYLRVFDSEKYSERLFDYVTRYWRHIGSVNMIGGPDFALFNLDIKEAYYMLFKRKQIDELFIDEPAALDLRLKNIGIKPSSDWQYTVNEFYCTDAMWRETVSQLAGLADHVLLDLRNFNQQRKGAEFELQLLATMGLLEHTTVVVDNRTDWNAIKSALSSIPDAVLPEQCVIEMDGKRVNRNILAAIAS